MIARVIHLQSRIYWGGIILLFISLFFLCLIPKDGARGNGLFMLNFLLTVLYFFVLLFNKKQIPPVAKFFHWIILFTLLLVSAWALNRDIPVFDSSVTWLTVMQVLVCATLILSAFSRFLSPGVNHVCAAILGLGLPIFIYLSLYIFPLYALSIVAAFAIGISLNSFAPVLITIAIFVLLPKMIRRRRAYLYSFLSGTGIAILITIIFCARWSVAVNDINNEYRQAIANENSDIPVWIKLSQHISQDNITKKILKTGIVYTQTDWNKLNLFWSMPSKNFDEPRKHDPLITVASLFTRLDIGEDDKIKILESSFDSRHQTEERLWLGDHLSTENVFTHAQIWPALQLAYLEKTITIKNNNPPGSWPRSEEAIYTFYLPEGSVVSSLSLWINGVEEKGVLTTKEKATEAYKTIVGVESRDPSVVHWQEGNTVTVRVFPVMAGNNRVFKIGITSPLIKKGNNVFFQNVYFKGPSYSNANETIHLNVNGITDPLSIPDFFEKKRSSEYEYKGAYKDLWQTGFSMQEIKPEFFSFQGKSYSINRYQEQFENKSFDACYLDINSSWKRSEFDEVLKLFKNKNVFVNDNGIVQLTPSNTNELYERLHNARFSLFPLYDISDPGKSLLITKGNLSSPNISDLRGTVFSKKLDEFIKSRRKSYVTDIGDDLSPYLKTLREYRAIQYEMVSLDQLKKEITDNVFPKDQETANLIVLKDAGLMISRTDTEVKSTAPDHLLRLFAYNNVMRQVKQTGGDTLDADNAIIKEAEMAHIVSPVSSLIVLETQQDYDRFNIHDSKEGLQNASHKKAGAVPEPHEWILIILAALLFLYLSYSSRLKKLMC
ncbi:MAG: XrtN system VIT domain-containing protein [Bacteroidota bacterium]